MDRSIATELPPPVSSSQDTSSESMRPRLGLSTLVNLALLAGALMTIIVAHASGRHLPTLLLLSSGLNVPALVPASSTDHRDMDIQLGSWFRLTIKIGSALTIIALLVFLLGFGLFIASDA